MIRTSIVLRGTRPLLTNRMTPEELQRLHDKTKAPKSAGRPSPEDVAASKVYTANGQPCLPVENLMSCLIEAGKFIRLDGKRQLSTSDSTILPGLLTIEDEILPLLKYDDAKDPTTWGIATWQYDMRQGRNPNGGEAVCIIRPRFDRWAVRMTVQMDTDSLAEDQFRQLFDHAGRRIGIGDFRPERKGIFGQFVVNLWASAPAVAA
jgi:hypothetical protein